MKKKITKMVKMLKINKKFVKLIIDENSNCKI